MPRRVYPSADMNLETPAGMSLGATRTDSLKGFVAEIFARLGVHHDAAPLTPAARGVAPADIVQPAARRLAPPGTRSPGEARGGVGGRARRVPHSRAIELRLD